MEGKGWRPLVYILYIVFGFYFINYPFNLITIPKFISQYDLWLILVGGVLLIFGAVNYFKAGKKY